MQGQSKKERRIMRKQERQLEKTRLQNVKNRKKIIFRVSIGIFILVISYLAYNNLFDYSGKGLLQPTKSFHNFGSLSVKSDVVSTDIELVNIGEGPLTIDSLDTSCGCTSASIIMDGIESPLYGMQGHSISSPELDAQVQSGDSVVLRIYYNPKAHPDLRGQVTRLVNIYTDDPSKRVHQIRIGVNQID